MKNLITNKVKNRAGNYPQNLSFDSLIEKLKELGYSVFVRNSAGKKVIMWSTKTHWASASFIENSEDDLKRVCQRLEETIYNVSFPNAR